MRTVYSDRHRLHHGTAELIDGTLQPCYEKPERANLILARVRDAGLGEVVDAGPVDLDAVRRVHEPRYVDFLATAWEEWTAQGRTHDALPLIWPVPAVRHDRVPHHIDGKLGYFAMDAGAPITAGTWEAATAGAAVALTAAAHVAGGAPGAFALCRPPGHHAGAATMGGYCYLNNAAIAAQYLRDRGCAHVAVLDVDYHHGNGTQSLFYERRDVLFVSIHADPWDEYPYFLGYADEEGAGAGEGYTLNYPLPQGTAWGTYGLALGDACDKIAAFGPDAVVVSLGVDTYEHDPISRFRLTTDDYPRMGARIAAIGRPTVFVMEGGYAVDDIGVNAVNVLAGFEDPG